MKTLKIKDGKIMGFKTEQGKEFPPEVKEMFKKNKPQEIQIIIVSNGKQQARIRVLGTICVKTTVEPRGVDRKNCRTLPNGLQWCP